MLCPASVGSFAGDTGRPPSRGSPLVTWCQHPAQPGTPASPGFVAMFVGHGLVVEAPHTGDVVNVVTCASLIDRGVSTLWRID